MKRCAMNWSASRSSSVNAANDCAPTQSVFDVFKSGELFVYVITVCDETSAERCPIFPGVTTRLHWSFPDPAALTGTREERLTGTRGIRDQIRERIEMWCDEMCAVES